MWCFALLNNSNEVSFLSYLILKPTYQKKKKKKKNSNQCQSPALTFGSGPLNESAKLKAYSNFTDGDSPASMLHALFLLIKYKLHPNSFLTFYLKYILISFPKIGFEFNPIILNILNFYYRELQFGESCAK